MNDPANTNSSDYPTSTADAWIDQGWNVGVFYWDQFSDELSVFKAEEKIWKPPPHNLGMRYRTSNGGYSTSGAPAGMSVVDIFVDSLKESLRDYKGNLRFVGHSLGSQVVLLTAYNLLRQANSGELAFNLVPDRVAIMDPYFSLKALWINPQSYLPDGEISTAITCLKYARELRSKGTVLELVKTSPLARVPVLCDPNKELIKLCASVERFPDWIGQSDWQGRHIAAPNIYFHSFAFPPPPLKTALSVAPSFRSPSASSTNDEIRECMRLSQYWKFVQVEGRGTFDVDDDEFELKSR
eukprot:CAMPEP_0196570678 /NCGR_PEP_ID=MMETSP1081-20130531/833_1 /TAXON_ID=36882 /ORGANISM="Pyramimonas amylifera, Strain CCMP720" /LENGTH=296 /DNA_ID=CAMNT_0041887251 /DNA_START=353 /DNA_END=1243 /DNA_ORIENTATION=+